MTRKPNPDKLSPRDRVATIAHLADTIEHNAQHSYNHARSAARMSKRLKDDPNAETVRHNAEHSLKHASDVREHAMKLVKHLAQYPGAAAAYNELTTSSPSSVPSPRKKSAR